MTDIDTLLLEDLAIEAIVLSTGVTEAEAATLYGSKHGEGFFREMLELIDEGLSPGEAASEVTKNWSILQLRTPEEIAKRTGKTQLEHMIAAALAANA
jgi:hypothetical protein